MLGVPKSYWSMVFHIYTWIFIALIVFILVCFSLACNNSSAYCSVKGKFVNPSLDALEEVLVIDQQKGVIILSGKTYLEGQNRIVEYKFGLRKDLRDSIVVKLNLLGMQEIKGD